MTFEHISVHEWFFDIAERRPEAIAIESAEVALTYSELAKRARQCAAALARDGAAPGDMVAILCEDPVEFVVALLGVLTGGGVAMPLDPVWPKQRVTDLLAFAQPRLALQGKGKLRVEAARPEWLSFGSSRLRRL